MSKQTIVITGTSTGFGRDTAETLAKHGYHVFATMRDIHGKNKIHASALESLAKEHNLSLTVVELDVTQDVSVDNGIKNILQTAGHIDVLINNAGFALSGISEGFTLEQMQAQFNVNVFGIQRLMRAVLPNMRHRHEGLVINISSVVGRVTMPFMGVYGATKHAVEALSESYRYELSPFGIEVALIQPSAYPTDIFHKIEIPSDASRIADYGDVAKIPETMFSSFSETFAKADAPNPHEVVETIHQLIEKPKGQRSARTVVGYGFGADAINDQAAKIQQQVLAGLNMSQLDKVQPAMATRK